MFDFRGTAGLTRVTIGSSLGAAGVSGFCFFLNMYEADLSLNHAMNQEKDKQQIVEII
jgi:hypothetical protein